MMDMGSEEEELSIEPEGEAEDASLSHMSGGGDFDSFGKVALDTTLPMPERLSALKEAIMACMGTDYEQEGSGAASSLAGIFGG